MNAINKMLAGLLLATGLSTAALAAPVVGNTPYAVESFGQQADQGSSAYTQSFTTPSNTVLEAIQWWGFHGVDSGGPGFDNFVVSLDNVVQTGDLSSVAVWAADGSYLYDLYTLDVTDALLTASSLTLLNDSPDVEWYWQSATAVGSPDAPSSIDVAFSLLGHAATTSTGNNVPEPGSLALVLLALAALGAMSVRARS